MLVQDQLFVNGTVMGMGGDDKKVQCKLIVPYMLR